MKLSKSILVAIVLTFFCVSYSFAFCGVCEMSSAEKGSDKKGSGAGKGACQMKKGSGAETFGPENVQVSGHIYFSEYYSMSGEKCAAFLEGKDGSIYCILDTLPTAKLKEKLNGEKGDVRVIGVLKKNAKGKYLEVNEYEVLSESHGKSSEGEQKESGYKRKGSY